MSSAGKSFYNDLAQGRRKQVDEKAGREKLYPSRLYASDTSDSATSKGLVGIFTSKDPAEMCMGCMKISESDW
jgi:hypothetical protein